MLDLLISFSKAPLNFVIYMSLLIFSITSVIAVFKIYQYFFLAILPGYTSTILAIFFFGSLNLLVLGFIGRYISNIYTEAQQRPLYHIEKKINFWVITVKPAAEINTTFGTHFFHDNIQQALFIR